MSGRMVGWSLVLVSVLGISGCAGTPGATAPAAPSAAPSLSAPSCPAPDAAATPPPAQTPSAAPAAPMPGAYVAYEDGIIAQTAGTKVLFFHAPWCPQCRKLDEELLAQGAPDDVTVFKVDYDSRGDLRQKYGVTLQTTVVYVDDAGQPLSSTVLYDDPSSASLLAAAP